MRASVTEPMQEGRASKYHKKKASLLRAKSGRDCPLAEYNCSSSKCRSDESFRRYSQRLLGIPPRESFLTLIPGMIKVFHENRLPG